MFIVCLSDIVDTAYPIDANYLYGDRDACTNTRDKRIETYLKNDAKYLEISATEAKWVDRIHVIINLNSWVVMPEFIKTNKQPIIYAAPSWYE